jgi:hypothetical protein
VRSATGETVMIGAGALAQDTSVSISRIELGQLDALGLPVLINHGRERASTTTIDWDGTPSADLRDRPLKTEPGLAGLFCAQAQEKTLAEITGLTVRVKSER